MHHPLYATGTGGLEPRVGPLWQILYDHGADVILNGHDHRYERLARIDPNDSPDPNYGIRPIIAGTGGDPGSGTTATNEPNSEVKIFGTAGILRMDLSSTSYTWKFIAVDGTASGNVMDQGTESCHAAPGSADTTPPTIATMTPTNGATGVAVSSINNSTFTLLKQGTMTPVSATVAYDPTTKTATLTPGAALEAGVTYTATVKGGSGGVKDVAGNVLAADTMWRFTTQPALAAPSNLSAARSGSLSNQLINLAWTDNSNSETNYAVQRSTNKVHWSELASLPANATSYRDTALQRKTTYYYWVFAEDSARARPAPSNVASATTK
jgi:Bacterial Ig-like domain